MCQNASKYDIFHEKHEKFSSRLPRPFSQWGGGYPLTTPYPLDPSHSKILGTPLLCWFWCWYWWLFVWMLWIGRLGCTSARPHWPHYHCVIVVMTVGSSWLELSLVKCCGYAGSFHSAIKRPTMLLPLQLMFCSLVFLAFENRNIFDVNTVDSTFYSVMFSSLLLLYSFIHFFKSAIDKMHSLLQLGKDNKCNTDIIVRVLC